jgi:hypothetical protein
VRLTADRMVWDDELERLALEVADVFGDEVVRSAMHRALRTADTQRTPRNAGGIVFGEGQLESALRDELLKLLRPH